MEPESETPGARLASIKPSSPMKTDSTEALLLELGAAQTLLHQQAAQIEKLKERVASLEAGIARRAELAEVDARALMRIKERLAAERSRAERAEAAERALIVSLNRNA